MPPLAAASERDDVVVTPRKGMALPAEAHLHASRMADVFGLSAEEIARNIEDLMGVAGFEPAED